MEDSLALHVSGATVRHRNRFEDIEVPRNADDPDRPFITEWVQPFYMTHLSLADETSIGEFAVAGMAAIKRIRAAKSK